MKKAVFCIVPSITQTNAIVGQLKSNGFGDDTISVLVPSRSEMRDATFAGVVGRLAGIREITIFGVGPFIAAGPMVLPLGTAQVGGFSGVLAGMGIAESDAKLYEDRVMEGNILVSVHTEAAAERDQARTTFQMAGAYEITLSSDAPAAPSIAADQSARPR